MRLHLNLPDAPAAEIVRLTALPEYLQPSVVIISGGRTEDGSDEHVAAQVVEELGRRASSDLEQTLAEFVKYRDRERKAHAGDAGVIVVPGDRPESPADGVGALLRYTV